MGYDHESKNRMELLARYNSLERKVNKEGIPSKLRNGYQKLVRYYEGHYKNPFLNETQNETHLRATNTTFSRKLDEFENEFKKLTGGEK